MKLVRLSDRIWYYPYEEERDRPNLGYIKGDNYSIAVDAGHSASHTEAFYRAIKEEGLPLPSLTVITHWHWDHTFGMHSINGLSIANSITNQHLKEFIEKLDKNGKESFINMHETIRKEYGTKTPVIVTTADIVFDKEMILDAGNCTVRLFQVKSTHTDDSTLIFVEQDKILFIGDANCGEFPSGVKNPELCKMFIDTISKIGAIKCLEGHWVPDTIDGIIKDIMDC